MTLFVGKFVNKIDGKERVSVPKAFRLTLRHLKFQFLFAYPHFKQSSVEVCDEEFMQRLSSSLEDLDMFSDEHDDLASVILANTHQLVIDPEGRVALPKILLKHAKLEKEAMFVGQGPRFQIWNPKIFHDFSKKAFGRARERQATLKLRRVEEVKQ